MQIITEVFESFFQHYKQEKNKLHLSYVITSTNRLNDPEGSPHKILGNAMDLTLRLFGDYAPITEYNDLFEYLLLKWQYRAGMDNTPANGNVHIHLDLGMTKKTHMPFFFIEDSSKYQKEITCREDIYGIDKKHSS